MNTPATQTAPEPAIADLQPPIAPIKVRARKRATARPSPMRHARAALRSIDKATLAFEDVASLSALGAARSALELWMSQQFIAVAPPVEVAVEPVTPPALLTDTAIEALAAQLQTRIEAFAVELAELVKRATLDAVKRVLDTR